CIDIALKDSPAVKAAEEEVIASEARKKEAFTNFLPTFSTSYTAAKLNKDPWVYFPGFEPMLPVPASEMTVGTRDNFTWAFEVKQPIFTGGAIYSGYKARSLGVDVANRDDQTRRLDVVLQVKTAYFSILKAEHTREVAAQAVEMLKSHRKSVQDFYNEEMIPRNDLLHVEVELANSTKSLLRVENGVEIAKANLNTVLHRPLNIPVEVEDIPLAKPFEKPLEHCLLVAGENRPEIVAAELKAHQAGYMVDIARSEYFPTIAAVGHFDRFGDDPSLKGSIYKDKENWYVAGVASWNFFEWGRTKNKVQASRATSNEALHALELTKDQVRLEAKTAFLDLQDAKRQVDVSKKAVEHAEENYRITVEHFHEQLGTNTDVLDAQTLLTSARTDLVNAVNDYNLSQARLERAMGLIVS
ncbi:MAG: TolC family protein, partial [Deltaproteobacteria bacterium]|nr:TolC family protein [Deltaproteobacteria bacterium]